MHPLRVVAGFTREPSVKTLAHSDAEVDAHAVDPAAAGFHSHEHAHSVRSLSSKLAAHDHSHRHCEDPESDSEANGHTHAVPRSRLPWESEPAG